MEANLKKIKSIIELSITIIMLLVIFLLYLFEKYRIVVFILGFFYCLFFLAQLTFSVKKLAKKEIPWGLIINILVLIFFSNDAINSNYHVVENQHSAILIIISIIVMTIVLFSILFICNKETLKEDFLSFIIICTLISAGTILYCIFPTINYSFDLTESKEIEVKIVEYIEEDSLKGAFFDRHSVYTVDSPEYININKISIDNDYKIEIGTPISIKYREGLFCKIYKIDYSKLAPQKN